MKKIYKILLLNIFVFIFPLIVKANSIDKIDMDIYLDSNGTAHIAEIWSANLNQGTEGYKPYYNIGNAKITNFKVSENGKEYAYQDNWNTRASFNNKAYKNGINYISDGLELCFGISSYGYHNYKLTYDIEGFVSSLNDSDMIYWNLVPYELSSKPQDVHIKIYSDNYFSDTLDVWGYGKYGATAYVYDGYIEMNSEGILDSNEYMTVLVKFDKGTFNTYNKIDKDFKYYKDMADKGAVKYKKNTLNVSVITYFFSSIFISIIIIFTCFIVIYISILLMVVLIFDKKNKVGNKIFIFENKSKKLPKNILSCSDIPFNNDIYRAFWIAESYKLNKKKTDFLGAILLKWLKENKINIKRVNLNIKEENKQFVIDLTNKNQFDNDFEEKLYNMMYKASGDGLLETKEFEKWCKKNYSKILKWFDNVLDNETKKLEDEGKIIKSKLPFAKIIIRKYDGYKILESMKDEAIKLKALKNFLEEFTRIDDKEAIEVNLWEYYLIYAQILGIADKVAKQFKKLYPEIIENPELGYTYNDFIFINMISHSGMRSASQSKSRAESYSSGGGGFSSGGGGEGSFGSGGGGGGFR